MQTIYLTSDKEFLLEHYKCFILYFRHECLTWHDIIPKDKIWLKIGGDKGGGSFKMAFQIANTENLNAEMNTVVFAAFEAPDNLCNIKLGLDKKLT